MRRVMAAFLLCSVVMNLGCGGSNTTPLKDPTQEVIPPADDTEKPTNTRK